MTRTIRTATHADLERLLALDRACFAHPWTAAQWRGELDGNEQLRPLVLLALDGDEAVGCASAPLLVREGSGELRRIAVVAAMRGRGIGGDLIARVIDHARAAKCLQIQLEVASSNDAAIALYQRMGFRRVGTRPRYYRDPIADAVLMDLDITAQSPF